MEKMGNGWPVKIRTLAKQGKVLVVIMIAALLGGCCGMTSVQSHGGGAGGFASLGAMILGTAAMQRLCEPDRGSEEDEEVSPPPDTSPEGDEDPDKSAHNDGISVASTTPLTREVVATGQTRSCLD